VPKPTTNRVNPRLDRSAMGGIGADVQLLANRRKEMPVQPIGQHFGFPLLESNRPRRCLGPTRGCRCAYMASRRWIS